LYNLLACPLVVLTGANSKKSSRFIVLAVIFSIYSFIDYDIYSSCVFATLSSQNWQLNT